MKITLKLKAKHFQNTRWAACRNCAISKSYLELTGNKCKEHVDFLEDLKTKLLYDHSDYPELMFDMDRKKAFTAGYDDTVIRKIKLIQSK